MANDETVKAAGINTRLAHSGNDPHAYFGFVNPPVVHASTVLFADARSMADRNQKYTYGTRGTPTSDALAAAINELEGSAGTVIVPSGLADSLNVPSLMGVMGAAGLVPKNSSGDSTEPGASDRVSVAGESESTVWAGHGVAARK